MRPSPTPSEGDPRSRQARNRDPDSRAVVNLESGEEVVIPAGEAERREIDERIADAYESKYALRPDPDEGDDSSWYRLRRSTALARARLPADGDPLYLRLTADEHLHAGD